MAGFFWLICFTNINKITTLVLDLIHFHELALGNLEEAVLLIALYTDEDIASLWLGNTKSKPAMRSRYLRSTLFSGDWKTKVY